MAKKRRRIKREVSIKGLRDLVKEECANFSGGKCLWGWPCPINGFKCKYFERCVLPLAPELEDFYHENCKGIEPDTTDTLSSSE